MNMQTTIVYAHPYEGSLNHAILERLVATLEAKGHPVTVLDLYADQFNPVLSAADLAVYGEGKTTDPQVERYVQILDQTEQIIFIYPIWWGGMPAILKGFVDRVLVKGFAYDYSDNPIPQALLKGRTGWVITTHDTVGFFARLFMQDYGRVLARHILRMVGIRPVQQSQLAYVRGSKPEKIAAFLDKIQAQAASL